MAAALRSGPDLEHRASLRAFVESYASGVRTVRQQFTDDGAVVGEDEDALFSALALAIVGEAAGLPILRPGGCAYATSSGIESGLCQVARLLLGDLEAPLSFINASMLGELAVLVGALPPR